MSAASRLLSLTLDNGWVVTKHLARPAGATGGTFSESYEVRQGARIGFLKAFDFSDAFGPGVDTANEVQRLSEAYNHERDVLTHCGQRKLSRVVIAIEDGSVQVPGFQPIEGRVFYMIFEMAEGDVRVQMDITTRFGPVLCMRALRDVCLGLNQVHREMIAHQDTKPSNVLAYGEGKAFKVADFGRSSRKGRTSPHDHFKIPGDRSYAPPELLYGFIHPEFAARRIGCDMYMLGNLAGFLFSGVNVTALLLAKLDPQHQPAQWGGTYQQLIPYLENAFASVLSDVAPQIDEVVREDVLKLLREMCTPNLEQRGHPRGLGRPDQYSLNRYVSQLDLAARRAEIRLSATKRAA
jgi:eukaryotic-like serine/threonine-protein kinase